MVKKQNLFIAIALFLLFSISFGSVFVLTKNKYLYSRFVFDINSFVWCLLLFFLAIAILLLVMLLCRNSSVAKLAVLLPVTLIVWWGSLAFLGFVVDNFWKSETFTFKEFNEVDYALEKEVDVAGLSIEDLTQCNVESVEGFEYNYQAHLLYSTFKLKGEFVYSEESYDLIKQAFLSDDEFTEVIYTNEENSLYNMTGYFKFENNLPMHQTKTSVDEWDKLIIRFNDETHSFYFDLSGEYDT